MKDYSESEKKRESVSAQSVFDSLWLHGSWSARLLCSWDFPGKNTGEGSQSLLQGPRDWTWVSCVAGWFFTVWVTKEAHEWTNIDAWLDVSIHLSRFSWQGITSRSYASGCLTPSSHWKHRSYLRNFIKVALNKSIMKVHTFRPNNLLWKTYNCLNTVTYKQGGLL